MRSTGLPVIVPDVINMVNLPVLLGRVGPNGLRVRVP